MSDVDLDISDLVKELCLRADVEYEATSFIEISPHNLSITVLVRNEHGSFYLDKRRGRFAARAVGFRVLGLKAMT